MTLTMQDVRNARIAAMKKAITPAPAKTSAKTSAKADKAIEPPVTVGERIGFMLSRAKKTGCGVGSLFSGVAQNTSEFADNVSTSYKYYNKFDKA